MANQSETSSGKMKLKTRKRKYKKISKAKNTNPHFHSSIAPLVKEFRNLKGMLKKRHINDMIETPFKFLFMALYKGKLTGERDIRKDNNNIVKILETYSRGEEGFMIGGKCLKITAEDIGVIFGIPVKPVLKKRDNNNEEEYELFRNRYFKGMRLIRTNNIKSALKKALEKKTLKAVKDSTVLTCTMICCDLGFFGNSSGQFQKNVIESLYLNMNRTRWAEKIFDYLMDNVKNYESNKAIAGCTISLLYWLVEYVPLTSMKEDANNEIPRAARWDIDKINDAISKSDLSSETLGTNREEKNTIKTTLELSVSEEKILEGKIYDGGIVDMVGTTIKDLPAGSDLEDDDGTTIKDLPADSDLEDDDEALMRENKRLKAELEKMKDKPLMREHKRLKAELDKIKHKTLMSEIDRLRAELEKMKKECLKGKHLVNPEDEMDVEEETDKEEEAEVDKTEESKEDPSDSTSNESINQKKVNMDEEEKDKEEFVNREDEVDEGIPGNGDKVDEGNHGDGDEVDDGAAAGGSLLAYLRQPWWMW